jgi:hypothetical protein
MQLNLICNLILLPSTLRPLLSLIISTRLLLPRPLQQVHRSTTMEARDPLTISLHTLI